ncbi:hypothetical protein NQ314_018542 [Rhamnusium bicolor]|uniref:CCHC-type domain-containing protein n=1 Tax=Rhamnusium bicolor TaxID=1586634 RepID=A0AAV8WRT6_9CUCU|nr:hypothetical protein NQ314_018542 [Rhamnusium bicolor]
MASGRFVEFNQGVDDFQIYSEKLEQFFTANNIKDDVPKVANLLSVIGVQPYKLLRNLCYPQLPKEKRYEELSSLLKKHFCPQVNIWRERKKFYSAKQDESDSVSDWYAKICSLAINCSFGGNLTDILKDKFVTGLRKGSVFDKVCEEGDNATLDRLKNAAMQRENYEANGDGGIENVNFIQRTGRSLRNPGSYGHRSYGPLQRQKSNQRGILHYPQENDSRPYDNRRHQWRSRSNQRHSNRNVNGNCKVCGVSHKGSCRYKGYTCKNCGIKGHLSKVCQKKSVNFINEDINGYVTNTFIDEGVVNVSETAPLFSIFSVNSDKTNQFLINVEIDGKKFDFSLDSGSSVNCINSVIYEKHFNQHQLRKDNIILKSYNGNVFTPIGYFVVNVKYLKVVKPLQIYVISGGGPCIVGRNFVEIFNLKFQMMHSIDNAKVNIEVNVLIKKYPEVFSSRLGTFKHAKISLNLKDNAKPIFLKPRPIPLAYQGSHKTGSFKEPKVAYRSENINSHLVQENTSESSQNGSSSLQLFGPPEINENDSNVIVHSVCNSDDLNVISENVSNKLLTDNCKSRFSKAGSVERPKRAIKPNSKYHDFIMDMD